MKKFIFSFALLISSQIQAAVISSSYFQVTYRDQIEFIICETPYCPQETLKAAGDALASELSRISVRTDFQASNFCSCNLSARPIESIVNAKKAQFVRSLARAYAEVISRQNASRPGLFFEQLLSETKNIYSTQYNPNLNTVHSQLAEKMKRASSFASFGSQNFTPLLIQSFVSGSIYNNAPANKGCLDRPDYSCISAQEVAAARRYMGTEYNDFNKNAFFNGEEASHLTPQVRHLINLINKLKPAQTISFRGTGPDERLVNLRVGDVYQEKIFISSSLYSKVAQNFMAGAAQIFFTKKCALVSGAGALFEGEHEVICAPGTNFKLIHREYRGGNLYLFLEEV